jgi:hypothetical protein
MYAAYSRVALTKYQVLDPQYLRFLQQHGAKDPRILSAIEAWFRRKPWNANEMKSISAAAGIVVTNYDSFCPCELTHPGTCACFSHY